MALGSYKLKTNKFNSFKEPLDQIFINIPDYFRAINLFKRNCRANYILESFERPCSNSSLKWKVSSLLPRVCWFHEFSSILNFTFNSFYQLDK